MEKTETGDILALWHRQGFNESSISTLINGKEVSPEEIPRINREWASAEFYGSEADLTIREYEWTGKDWIFIG